MPGWNFSVGPVGIWTLAGADDGAKANLFPIPAGTGVQWMPELIWKMHLLLARELRRLGGGSPGVPGTITNLQFTANNGVGDSAGVGTFTITFVTS